MHNMGRIDFEREAAKRYITHLNEAIKNCKHRYFVTLPFPDYKHDALILYCIENGHEYEYSCGGIKIDLGEK